MLYEAIVGLQISWLFTLSSISVLLSLDEHGFKFRRDYLLMVQSKYLLGNLDRDALYPFSIPILCLQTKRGGWMGLDFLKR